MNLLCDPSYFWGFANKFRSVKSQVCLSLYWGLTVTAFKNYFNLNLIYVGKLDKVFHSSRGLYGTGYALENLRDGIQFPSINVELSI